MEFDALIFIQANYIFAWYQYFKIALVEIATIARGMKVRGKVVSRI